MIQSKVTLQLDKIKFNSNKLAVSEPSVGIIANQLYQRVLDGEVSAIDTYEAAAFMGKVADSLKGQVDELGKNNFTDLVRDEIAKNQTDKGFTTRFGSKFSLAENGTKYNFNKCGDKLWVYYESEIARIKKLKDEREKLLKALTAPMTVSYPDPETGELLEGVELIPPTKTSTSGFKVELNKD